MLTLTAGSGSRDCRGMRRRDFLEIGSLALGGLSLSQLLSLQAAAAASGRPFVNDRSVVLLYLSGGASHIETFDPKMTAPGGVRSVTGEVKTRIPGLTFGGTLPQLAAQADKLAVVRSFTHNVGSHPQAHVHVLSGGTDPVGNQQTGFSMGACYCRLRGANHPETGAPSFTLLTEREVDGQYRKELARVARGSWPGSLGPACAPFRHEIGWGEGEDDKDAQLHRREQNPLLANLKLNLSRRCFDDRIALLKQLDRIGRQFEGGNRLEAVDKYRAQAVDVLLGGTAEAFDLSREDPRLLARYDTSRIRIGHKIFRPSTLGRQMLLARRLCEAGCGFVTVHSAGWDMHADGNNPGMYAGMEMLGRTLDQAVSAFLEDVWQRGLEQKILLVITGDFGRTPKLNKRGGRDHWARLGTLAFAGGGLTMGQVIGRSTPGVDAPAADPVTPRHLMATVMHALFDVGKLRLEPAVPSELMQLLDGGAPIRALF